MKYITIILLFLCLMSCHNGRQSSCENVPVEKDSVQLRVIPVSISDTAYRNVDQTFEQISYVVLSDNVVIGEIVRTLVSDERIFILDNQNKLFCFDMQGKVEYVIDEHGPGPNEYGNVLDFALNPPLKMLWMYDSARRKLHCYDMYTGKRRQSISATYMAPERMAIWNGSFFFFMGDHYNYPDNPEMHYSLFCSLSGTKIDKSFFPHDRTSEFRFSYGKEHPFYYNNEKLYFIAYIQEHFGIYISPGENRPLEYEHEYLIGGNTDDMENLQEVLDKIRNLRMAPNYFYLQTDETKKAEAKVLAGVVSTLMGNPELTDVVCQIILMAWAYGESVMDLRTLTAGGKVPAAKSKETWKLSLSGLLKLGTKEDSGASEAGESGFGYDDYMKMLFLLESKETLRLRMLDLIEWNMKMRLDCPFFQADACITKLRIQSTCRLRRGITYQFSTYYAYQ